MSFFHSKLGATQEESSFYNYTINSDDKNMKHTNGFGVGNYEVGRNFTISIHVANKFGNKTSDTLTVDTSTIGKYRPCAHF